MVSSLQTFTQTCGMCTKSHIDKWHMNKVTSLSPSHKHLHRHKWYVYEVTHRQMAHKQSHIIVISHKLSCTHKVTPLSPSHKQTQVVQVQNHIIVSSHKRSHRHKWHVYTYHCLSPQTVTQTQVARVQCHITVSSLFIQRCN